MTHQQPIHARIELKTMILLIGVILTLSLFFVSCQKEVKVDIPEVEKHIVIQAEIEADEYPFVIVTKSSGYFESVDTSTLVKMFAFNAKVSVSDGSFTEILSHAYDNSRLPPFIYRAKTLKGKSGGTYTLKVEVDGKTYTSVVTIPAPIKLDSLFFKVNREAGDSLGLMHAYLKDPPGLGNYYRWFAKRIKRDSLFYAPTRSVFDDRLVDGKGISFDFPRGRNPNSNSPEDTNRERRFFKKGDRIVVKLCTMPKEVFDFYKSYEMQLASNGNPFAAPSTVKSNIEGGALGIWAAYGAYLDTVLAK